MFFNEVFIYGAGYVGMSMASLIGQKHQVTIIENNSEKINLINSCSSPVKDDLVQEYLAKKKLNIKAVKKLPQSFSKIHYSFFHCQQITMKAKTYLIQAS